LKLFEPVPGQTIHFYTGKEIRTRKSFRLPFDMLPPFTLLSHPLFLTAVIALV
jgi:hypothetical protein